MHRGQRLYEAAIRCFSLSIDDRIRSLIDNISHISLITTDKDEVIGAGLLPLHQLIQIRPTLMLIGAQQNLYLFLFLHNHF